MTDFLAQLGWEQDVCPSSGKTFFWCELEQRGQWDAPYYEILGLDPRQRQSFNKNIIKEAWFQRKYFSNNFKFFNYNLRLLVLNLNQLSKRRFYFESYDHTGFFCHRFIFQNYRCEFSLDSSDGTNNLPAPGADPNWDLVQEAYAILADQSSYF